MGYRGLVGDGSLGWRWIFTMGLLLSLTTLSPSNTAMHHRLKLFCSWNLSPLGTTLRKPLCENPFGLPQPMGWLWNRHGWFIEPEY